MDAKKIIQTLFTGGNVSEALASSEGNLFDPRLALAIAFSHRFSEEGSFDRSIDSWIFLSRKDFPSMAEREVVRFPSGKNTLTGYLYRTSLSKGLVFCVHGLTGQADDFFAIAQDYFLRQGYDVFSFDLTASGRSQGLGIDGLHQSALDVKAAYEYILSRGDFTKMKKYLFGHSWGAYGVAASLNFPSVRPNGVAALAGFDTPLKEMVALPSSKAGIPLDFSKDAIKEALAARCGQYYDLSASRGIIQSGVKTLLIHGDQDQTVPLGGASTYEAVGEEYAKHILLPRGHLDIFLEEHSLSYAEKIKAMGAELTARYGKDVTLIPDKEKEAFLSSFDRRMTSVANPLVFDAIDAFFQGRLS